MRNLAAFILLIGTMLGSLSACGTLPGDAGVSITPSARSAIQSPQDQCPVASQDVHVSPQSLRAFSTSCCQVTGTCDWCGADVCVSIGIVGGGASGGAGGCGTTIYGGARRPQCTVTAGGNADGGRVTTPYVGACALDDPADPTNDPATGSSVSRVPLAASRSPGDIASFCRKLWGFLKRLTAPPQIYPVIFREDHFVAQHLQGVVSSSVSQVEAAVVADIQSRAVADPDFPESELSSHSQTYTIAFNDNGTMITLAYRVYLYQSSNGPTLSVGTVYRA